MSLGDNLFITVFLIRRWETVDPKKIREFLNVQESTTT
jgi:hypothetical protein